MDFDKIYEFAGKEYLKVEYREFEIIRKWTFLDYTTYDLAIKINLDKFIKAFEKKPKKMNEEEEKKWDDDRKYITAQLDKFAKYTAKKLSKFRVKIYSYVLEKMIKDLKNKKVVKPLKFHLCRNNIIHIFPLRDSVQLIYGIHFKEKDDQILARVFLQELKDKNYNKNCIFVNVYEKKDEVPKDILKFDKPENYSNGLVVFNLLVDKYSNCRNMLYLFMKKSDPIKKSFKYFITFREYIQFHIHSIKTFLHIRMNKKRNEIMEKLDECRIIPENKISLSTQLQNLQEKLLNLINEKFDKDLSDINENKRLNIQYKIIKIINDNYNSICNISSNEDEFKDNFRYKYNQDYDLEPNYNSNLRDIFENILNILLVNFKNDLSQRNQNKKLNIKVKYLHFINSNYNKISQMSSNIIEFKNNFLMKVRQNNELNSLYDQYQELYDESLNTIIGHFNTDLTKRIENKILKLFIDNYNSISNMSSNEEVFKNNFRNKFYQDSELNSNYNNFRNLYENILNIYLVNFRKELSQRNENAENIIKNKILKFFNDNYNDISATSSAEDEFKNKYKNKFDLIPELRNIYNQYINYYDMLLNDKCEIFLVFLKNKNEKEKADKENKILQFFNTNYSELSENSSTEEEFINNIERKKNLDNELLINLDRHQIYYDKILNDNLIKFRNNLKNRIENLFDKKYIDAIELSKDENDFKNKLKELLEQKQGIRSLLQKSEYKNLYEQLISENLTKIRRDIEKKEEARKNQNINKINEFIDSNYIEIYRLSNLKMNLLII